MAGKQIITVFGATGAQGGSVCRALLANGRFTVRAATRQLDSPKAKELEAAGAVLVQASYNDRVSLSKALEGAYGTWFITSFWDSGKGTVPAEVELGRNVAQAAKENDVRHIVYSTLESPAAISGEHFPTFDAKVGVEQQILYLGIPFTFVQVAWYYNNLENNHKTAHSGWYNWPKDAEGRYQLTVPIGQNGMHGIHHEDVGEACASIFNQPGRFLGRKVALSGELLTGEIMLSAFQAVFPKSKFVYNNPLLEEYKASLNPKFGDGLWRMYKWYQFQMPEGGDLALSQELNPQILSFPQYLHKHADRYHFE